MSVEPMRAMTDDSVRVVCVVSPAQLMKTEFAINCGAVDRVVRGGRAVLRTGRDAD